MSATTIRHSIAGGLALVLAALACAGCARRRPQPTIADWQHDVARYVRDAGGPAALRDGVGPDGRPGFSVLGSERAERSTDVHSVLLGRKVVAGRPWLLFLVGRVRNQSVEDIRLAALSDAGGGEARWVLGAANEAALAQYRQHNDRLWRERFPGRRSAPPEYLGFPRAEDVFELAVKNDQLLTAAHPASGAHWKLELASGGELASGTAAARR